MWIALHSLLRDGQELGYEAAHERIPDDLLASLQRVGIREWRIWRSGGNLFHLVDCDDFEAALRQLADDPADKRWQEEMAAFVERFAENPDGVAQMALRHVWTLSEQAAP
ncbi:MAG TPA: L-rhamnose mutarotase [Candidatus Limnocylindrales bacterium]